MGNWSSFLYLPSLSLTRVRTYQDLSNWRGLLVYNLSVCPSVCLSITRFPEFSWLYFPISGWKLVASFCMKSYRSSSTFVTVNLLFHELLPFVQTSFPGLFSAMLLHIWMEVGSKLHMKSYRSSLTFLWVNALCSKFFLQTFLSSNEIKT